MEHFYLLTALVYWVRIPFYGADSNLRKVMVVSCQINSSF